MESINRNIKRVGNFTSSEIAALMSKDRSGKGKGEPFFTYIQECNMERRLRRPLGNEAMSKPLAWGKLVETRVFDLLGTEYRLCSQDTIVHPEINYWAGSPDAEKYDEGKTVIDIKCPISLKSFCQLVDPIYECNGNAQASFMMIRARHKEGEKYYWQLVSNAILTGAKYAELIVYMPYITELQDIREMASNYSGNQNKIAWINWAEDEELPYIFPDGYYKNINIIRFEVPEADKQALRERVLEAGEKLLPRQ